MGDRTHFTTIQSPARAARFASASPPRALQNATDCYNSNVSSAPHPRDRKRDKTENGTGANAIRLSNFH